MADAAGGGRGHWLAVALPGAILLLGTLQVAANRHRLWLDGVSYLEIGEAAVAGDPGQALNLYWSPLYALALGLAVHLVRPGPAHEVLLVKAVDLLQLGLAAAAWHYLLRGLDRTLAAGPDDGPAPSRRGSLLGAWTLFAWAALRWSGADKDTPDLAVAALVYLAAGLLLRLRPDGASRVVPLALGLVLGVGYLAKTSVLVVAPAFAAAAVLAAADRGRGATRVAWVLLGLAVAAGPFAAALSWRHGRLTIGDAGRLNFAWYVSPGGIDDCHWQGEPEGSGRPVHPTRRVSVEPPIFEFRSPGPGTYPPWLDPGHWNQGLTPTFAPAKVARVAARNAAFAYRLFGRALLLGLLLVALVGQTGALRRLVRALPPELVVPGAFGLALHLVAIDLTWEKAGWGTMQTRLIAPFAALLVLGLAAAASRAVDGGGRRLLGHAVAAASILLAAELAADGAWSVVRLGRGSAHVEWQVAEGLGRLGLAPGDAVALVGNQDHYWARLAGLEVVAEAPDPAAFWRAHHERGPELLGRLAATGARAAVAVPVPAPQAEAAAAGWTALGGGYFAVRLDR
jgi:hypothetical protein